MQALLKPSLYHMSSCRIVSALFNHHEVTKNCQEKDYDTICSQIKASISSLSLPLSMEKELEGFIYPMYQEIRDWSHYNVPLNYFIDFREALLETIPQCWLSNGTIDREKSVSMLAKNNDVLPVNRFAFACLFVRFNDVLDLWAILSRFEKAYLRTITGNTVLQLWIQWLESNLPKDLETFLAQVFQTSLWYKNAFILKHALQILSPAERGNHVLKAFSENEIRDDVMRICFSLMTKEEQELIISRAPVRLLGCLISWPFRTVFNRTLVHLWPHFNKYTFFICLNEIKGKLKIRKNDSELLNILKYFWEESPDNFKNFARGRPLFSVLDPIINSNASQELVDGRQSHPFHQAVSHTIRSPEDEMEFQQICDIFTSMCSGVI